MKAIPRRQARALLVGAALLSALVRADAPSIYLTAPSREAPREIVYGYLRTAAASLGLEAADLAGVAVTDEYRTRHNGVTHVYLRQSHEGLEIFNAVMNANVDSEGRLFGLGGAFVSGLAGRHVAVAPVLSAEGAIGAGLAHLGLQPRAVPAEVGYEGGSAQQSRWRLPELVAGEIPVRLQYYRDESDELRLVWNVSFELRNGEGWWNYWVDAVSGAIVARENWIDHATYRVFALPKESPDDGPRTDEIDPHDAIASPEGWHDTDGLPGPESTLTMGNNVDAYTDVDSDNNPDPGSRPDGGGLLVFQPNLDLTTQQPSSYRPAAVVNLFYWTNILHDVFWRYGFDEPAGNFQVDNHGGGGLGNDDVRAEAQDGGGNNNANFSTPPDGERPRMQMFVWLNPRPNRLVVHSPPAIVGTYEMGEAGFGPAFTTSGITADLQLVNDGVGTTTDGCEAFTLTAGRIAVADRGNCSFAVKVKNAQNAGASAAVIVNNTPDPPFTMGGSDPTITIPSGMIWLVDGALLKSQLPSPGVNATAKDGGGAGADRDGDLDAGLIAHEYGHGVSNRLTGGPSNVGCLGNNEQAGEGWSDWMTLFLHSRPEDLSTTPRSFSAYLNFENPANAAGIRPYPYTIDMTVNPQTYDSIKTAAVPHGVGAVWAAMLWEMYWEFVFTHGFSADLHAGQGGNNLAFQLVMDGMKLQPCSPHFVDARDAILQADQVDNGGANQCRIWRAFAKRGLGFSASAGSSTSVLDGTEAFDLPASCQIELFSDGFEVGRTEHWSSTTG
ncbi:MAG: hypothetical protein F9K44_10575 [Hyphomicrobiaceae bacterium]|nr:MAG: hypothetical protein F9K44_10575 [Hyphomicrobiaceae bacterium]MBZ0143516.1 M36 family metallopeptidase [Rhodocyclaceae bacterium]